MRRSAIAALVLFAVLPSSAGAAAPRIFDGHGVAVPSYLAFLTISTDTAFGTCGATAISRNVVLTAAHCLYDQAKTPVDSSSLGLVFGVDDARGAVWNGTAPVMRVARYVIHRGFGAYDNGVVTNDVALLQTKDPVPGVISVLPPDRTDLLKVGTQALILGWGRTDESDPDSFPSGLQGAFMPLQSPGVCSSRIAHINSAVMLCAGADGGPAPCAGDSGGPVIVG